MRKKICIFLLAAAFAASAAACGDSGKGENKTDSTQEGGAKTDGAQDSASEADKIAYSIDDCVKLGDYSALQVSLANTYEVTKEQIEDTALRMAEDKAEPVYKDTDKDTVEEGDTVNIDYEGKKDGVAFAGGTDQGHNLTIGSHEFIDGFEDGLIGRKVGETLDLDLTFPENYGNAELRGAAVVFTVKINKILEEDTTVEFELTDEFVQANFDCETVKEYKENVKNYLETSNETGRKRDTRQAVVDKLQEICEVSIPEELLEARVSDYVVQFTNQNCSGTTLADYLRSNFNGMTEEDFRSEITTEMELNLNTELILEAIVKKEGIQLDEDGFQEYVKQQMSAYGFQSENDFYAANGVDAESGEKYERKIYVCNQALDRVVENAKAEYGVVSE